MAGQTWQAELKDWVISIGIALILAFFIRTFIIELYLVDGPSMQPTLQNGNRLVVSKFIYNFRDPRRGEVIVFQFPADTSRDFVKRVIGVPGDKIEIKEGKVFVNDKMIDEPYMQRDESLIKGRTALQRYFDFYPVHVVPQNTVFVLGDNRYNSEDSRDSKVGFVPYSLIKGKALMVFWPFSEMKLLP